jgi:predicted nuclease of predicted toxin-antitoxin system
MRILFDQGTPAPLIAFLEGHTVAQAKDLGWDKLVNGELLKAAEEAGFEVLLTTDKNMAAQQNLKSRTIAVVVLGNSQWRIVQRHLRKIAAALNTAAPGSYSEVDIPFR